jgi:hypothetical protein
MRIIVNENLIKKRAQTTQRAVILGVGLLGVAAVLSFNVRYLLPAYAMILPGMALSSWAMRSSDKWLRDPRTDQVLAKALKGLTQGYRLYSHILPAEHLLFSPAGLFILNVKHQDGKVSCRGERWHRPFNLGRVVRWLAEVPLGNPSRQVQAEVQRMQQFVSQHLPDTDVPMQPLVVFDSPKAELEIVEPTVPVLSLPDLKAYLRDAEKDKALPRQTQEALLHLFDQQASP